MITVCHGDRCLPRQLIERAEKEENPSPWTALDVMIAAAIELLLTCPAHWERRAARHRPPLHWRGTGNAQTLSLAISASEVKNEQPIETDLPVASSRLIRKYLRSYRAQVSTAPGSWLFPTRPGGTHISPSALSNHIFTVIHRETGLEVNAHLFRHLAGMLYLTRHPGQYEVFRRILGHKSVSTTTAFYTSFDSKWAIHHYDETILAQRDTVR